MSHLGELVLIGLAVALSEVLEVLDGSRRWAVVCADNAVVLPMLSDKSVDVSLSDPPYAIEVHSKQWVSAALTADGAPRASSKHRGIDFEALTAEQRDFCASEFARLTRRWCLAFSDIESITPWRDSMRAAGLDWVRACIWDKVDSCPQFTGDRPASACEAINISHPAGRKRWSGGGRRNLFSYAVNAERGDKPHPTTKPLPLMLELVELFTDPDELVLDPFAGSGTTGVACLRLGRRFIGMEKDAKYAAIARERLSAESQGLSLRDARAGQLSLLGGTP